VIVVGEVKGGSKGGKLEMGVMKGRWW